MASGYESEIFNVMLDKSTYLKKSAYSVYIDLALYTNSDNKHLDGQNEKLNLDFYPPG